MKKKKKFGVWFLLLQDIKTVSGICPAGTIVKCNRHAHASGDVSDRGACSFHTQDGLYRHVIFGNDYVNYKTAIPLDHPGYFLDYEKPTREEIDMLCMIQPHIDKSFLLKHLKVT